MIEDLGMTEKSYILIENFQFFIISCESKSSKTPGQPLIPNLSTDSFPCKFLG